MNTRDLKAFGCLSNPPSECREPVRAWWMDCATSCCAIIRTAVPQFSLEPKPLSCILPCQVQPKNSLRFLLAATLLLASQARATTNFIGGVITLTSDQTYSDPVVLTNDTTILSANGSSLTFASTLDGAYSLTVGTAGTTTFDGAVGGSTNLYTLVLGTNATRGSIVINSVPVTTSQGQTYNGSLTVSGTVTLTSAAAGNITFQPVSGTGTLTVSSAGTTEFDDGAGPGLASLTVGGGGTVVFNSPVQVATSGAQSYNESVLLMQNTTLTASSGNLNFDSTVNGGFALTVDATGNITFFNSVGASTPLSSLNVINSGTGTTIFDTATVKTSGSQVYGQPVIVNASLATFTSTGAGIVFSSTLDGAPIALTLSAAGTVLFGGVVGGSTPPNQLAVSGGGTVDFNCSAITTAQLQIYDENVSLSSNVVLTSLDGLNISFAGTINGAQSLTVNTSGPGETFFDGIVGGTTPPTSITVSGARGAVIQTTSITTSGGQSYSAVMLSNSPAITSTAGGTLSFGTINGPENLTLNSSGVTAFNGAVGGSTAPTGLTVGGGGSTELNTTSVSTSGTQSYNESVLLETTVSLSSGSGGSIIFAGTVDGAQSLTTTSPGTTVFESPVGSITPLSSLTVGGGGTMLASVTLTTTGAQLYNENVAVVGPVSCTSVGGGTITFASTVNGPSTLTLNTSGTAAVDAAVGGVTPLEAFAVGAGGTFAIDGGLVRTTGAQSYNKTVALGAAATLSGSSLSLPSLDGFGHVLTLSNALVSALGGLSDNLAQLVIAGGGSVALDATVSVPSVSVVAPATLTGSGDIIAPVTVHPGATLAPSLSSGPFTVTGSLSLSGTAVMELNASVPTNDLASVSGAITNGGTLTVTNLAGTLAAGDSFRLFQGSSYTGAFTNFNLPPLPAGLFWDTRGLTNNGSILVAALPVLTSIATTGPDAFQLTATGTPNEAYTVLASTNVALPVSQWWMLGSATADSSGTISFTDSTATNGSRFYLLGQ